MTSHLFQVATDLRPPFAPPRFLGVAEGCAGPHVVDEHVYSGAGGQCQVCRLIFPDGWRDRKAWRDERVFQTPTTIGAELHDEAVRP